MNEFGAETVVLDLPAVAGSFGRRVRDAGLPVTYERSAWFCRALSLMRPVTRRCLYFTARAVFVSDPAQLRAFNRVFAETFGGLPAADELVNIVVAVDDDHTPDAERHLDRESARDGTLPDASFSPPGEPRPVAESDVPVSAVASRDEVLRNTRFDALGPNELAEVYRLMARLRVEGPLRQTRRGRRDRHGDRIDLRRTLRGSIHTGGDPIRVARRSRRVVRRRVVMLCDISGSMAPYARAYLRFLTSAAGAGPNAEAFVFATRLTRVTRSLRSRHPARAIEYVAEAAPDWSSGTRIGDALKTFNDRYGRRGMARGAVVVILSDGWERGEPALVAREMERLRRLAYLIVWVNPRAAADGFSPRAGGMAAALPHCDALVSGHSFQALYEVVDAIAGNPDGARP